MHRKEKMVPWGHILGAVVLGLSLAALVLALFSVTATRANAGTRPYWNGRTPHVWTNQTPPVCVHKDAYHYGIIRTGNHYWRAECMPDGPGLYAWGTPVKR
jgi:hypothetical protein